MTEIRAPRQDEIDAALELLNAHGHAMWGEDITDAAEIQQWFALPGMELRAAALPDGRFAGMAAAVDIAEDHAIIWLRVTLHPELGTAELGEELLAEVDRLARERGRPGTEIHAGCAEPDERVAGIYTRNGYHLVRHFFRMIAPLDEPPAASVWPEGIELRPLDPDRDLERVHQVDEEAFEDHWGSARTSFATWRGLLIRPTGTRRSGSSRGTATRSPGSPSAARAPRATRTSAGSRCSPSAARGAAAASRSRCSCTRSPSSATAGGRRSGSASTPRT